MKFKKILVVCLVACLAPAAVNADYVDGSGDAVAAFGVDGPILDIDTLSVQFDATTLFFDMTFHTPISAPSDFAENSLLGFIELDTDQSDETGVGSFQNAFSPPFDFISGFGTDYLLLLDDSATPGFGALIDADQNFVNQFPLSYGPTSVSGQLPLSDIDDNGLLNFATIVGTLAQPTDASNNIATSTAAIPEPTTAGLLVATGLVGLVRRRNR